ncbi:MAG: hypothetical protein IIW17_05775 [Clostridia bacterium]|nr:hypothetical protein [Clostridia bacterium]
MKKITVLVCALSLLMLVFMLPAYAEEITSEQEEQYGYYFTVNLTDTSVDRCEINRYSDYMEISVGSFADRYDQLTRGYGICRGIPTSTSCQKARYMVIKYCNPYATRELDLVWHCSAQYTEYNFDNPLTVYVQGPSQSWNYAIVDMSNHELWKGALFRLGFALYADASTRNQGVAISWVKFYSEDPTELYTSMQEETVYETLPTQTEPPVSEPSESTTSVDLPDTTEPPETRPIIDFPDTTEPYYEETVWETYHEQEISRETDRELGGLFFEVFGDDALSGCKGQPVGCKNGSCNAVAGGFWVICLLAAGLVFRKKN